ncbi:hypothetical protein [Roseococcus sp.]|uniref:hypothetical protein n=1 Tax=Roseococcus sp. TaxID=2109646 RepID=UPI003BAC301A
METPPMLRHALLSGLILAGSAALLPARAQMATYCSGAIQALRFDTQLEPGAGGRATYSVLLRNSSAQARNFQLVVTAPFLGRAASAPRAIAPGATAHIALGYQLNQPGRPPLRANELAEVVRVTCQ